jgi:pimeloyl-ACP methyl ester carboxylesterase
MTESVIVAHGLWMPGTETRLLRHRLQAAGFRPFLFRFPTLRGTLSQNVTKLARFAADTPGDDLHFVGYSLGGVVTVSMLAETPLERVGRIVCLGSPLTGSGTAARLTGSALGRKVIGRSLLEHLQRGGIVRWNRSNPLGVIAGNSSLGVGRLLGRRSPANDGTVAVEETKLPGATAHLILPVSHAQLLFDRAVARQTIHFLRHGRFL